VVKDVCHYIADKHFYGQQPDNTCMFMRKLVEQEIEDYPSIIDISRRLNFTEVKDVNQVKYIVEEMFSDGVVNKGRIITLLAFGGLVSHLCKKRKLLGSTEIITNIISVFLIESLSWWIIKQGGWVSPFPYTDTLV
jgi:pyruvate/2-oxoglutarate/acetoin dehydrogenase E1 component